MKVFDDHFPCRKVRCHLEHVEGWLSYYQLSFNLFKRGKELCPSPVATLTKLIND